MKKLILLFLLSVSFVSYASGDPLDNVGNRCKNNEVLYYAQTVDHKKEVLVCQKDMTITYLFGRIGQKPDIELKMPVKMVSDLVTDNDTVSSEYLMIRNGNIIYQVGHMTDLLSGADIESLSVIKYGQGKLAEIMLDPDSAVNAIRDRFYKG